MYIMKRLSGGRGEYEIAETIRGLSPHSLLDRELQLVVGRYGVLSTGISLREQGGKLRLRIDNPGSTIHIHRQVSATALLPKPTRDEATLSGGFPIVFLNRYVLRRMDLTDVVLLPNIARLTIGELEVDNASGSTQRFDFADRIGRIERLHENSRVLPPRIRAVVASHQALLTSGAPLSQSAEDLVDGLMSLTQTEAMNRGLEYQYGTDVMPALEGIAGLPSPSPDVPAPLAPGEEVPGLVGGAYRAADEQAAVAQTDPFSVDPAIRERGLRGHATTQNALASYVSTAGLDPRSPKAGEPNFDLAWEDGQIVFVAEVKSMSFSNEEKQMRLGLGQILRYRQVLSRLGRPVIGVLAVEREPTDPGWKVLCNEVGVVLVWPPDLASTLDRVRATATS